MIEILNWFAADCQRLIGVLVFIVVTAHAIGHVVGKARGYPEEE